MKSASLVRKVYKRFIISFIFFACISLVLNFVVLQAKLYDKKKIELENFVELFDSEFNQKLGYYESMALQINTRSNLIRRVEAYKNGELSSSEVYINNNKDLIDSLNTNSIIKGIHWFDSKNQLISTAGEKLTVELKNEIIQLENDGWIGPFRNEKSICLAFISPLMKNNEILGKSIILYSVSDILDYCFKMTKNMEGFKFLLFVNADIDAGIDKEYSIDRFGVDDDMQIIHSVPEIIAENSTNDEIHAIIEKGTQYINNYIVSHREVGPKNQTEKWHVTIGVDKRYSSDVVYDFLIKTLFARAVGMAILAYLIWQILKPMMGKLIINEQELENTVKENMDQLNKSWEIINKTKNQLVEANKEKALSRLVQGLAHKINTPMGVVLTSNTFSKDLLDTFEKEIELNNMKKSDLLSFIDSVRESTDLIERNTSSIIDLVVKLKYLSEDHEDKRNTIYLKDTIMIIVDGLSKELEQKKYEVTINCSDLMTYHGYTEDFIQIVSNLVMNTLAHGGAAIKNGMIYINVFREQEDIVIEYNDNGKGILREHIDKIFEPYFTTSFGQGNGGLGLYIVENIVKSSLKGSIKCYSVPYERTTFIIKFPT